MHAGERGFEYNYIPDDKKVKLVALRVRKYASLWWTNLFDKRAKKGKNKVRTWAKIKSKHKNRFLAPSYLLPNYSQTHSSTQGIMTIEEYTRELEKLLMKCDLQEPKDTL